jgi:hypothetical protein
MATPGHPPLPQWAIKELAYALRAWANRHPSPSRPNLAFGAGPALSPRMLADRVERHAEGFPNEDAAKFLRVVQFGLEVAPLEKILAQLRGDTREEPTPTAL